MKRKFNFFDWASGKSLSKASGKGTGVRKFYLFAFALVGLLFVFVTVPRLINREAEDKVHSHEKGPHGGVVNSLESGDLHYHAELVVDDDGRVEMFFWGQAMKVPVAAPSGPVIAELSFRGKQTVESVILHPAKQQATGIGIKSELVGRLSADTVGSGLVFTIPHVEIAKTFFSVQFELPEISQEKAARALDAESKLILNPGGDYTLGDIEANGQIPPSEKYRDLHVSHSQEPAVSSDQCPVSGIKADSRVTWVVGGKTYHFCCAPCIVDFVSKAKGFRRKTS